MPKNKTYKQRCVILHLDNTFEEKKLTRDGGKIKHGQNEIIISPRNVFHERPKRIGKRLKGRRRVVFFVEGTRQALKFKDVPDPEDLRNKVTTMEDPNPFWNMGEAKEFVDKQVTKSLEKHKPMTWLQFFLLAGLNIIGLILLVVLLQGGGVVG